MLNAEIAHNMNDAGKCSSAWSNNLIELICNGFNDKKCPKTAILFCCVLLLSIRMGCVAFPLALVWCAVATENSI